MSRRVHGIAVVLCLALPATPCARAQVQEGTPASDTAQEAATALRSALDEWERSRARGSQREMLDASMKLARLRASQRNWSTLAEDVVRAMPLARALSDIDAECDLISFKAYIQEAAGRPDVALKIMDEAIALAERNHANWTLHKMVGRKGGMLDTLGRKAEALSAFHRGYALLEPHPEWHKGLPATLLAIGRVYLHSAESRTANRSDAHEAILYFNQGLRMLQTGTSPPVPEIQARMLTRWFEAELASAHRILGDMTRSSEHQRRHAAAGGGVPGGFDSSPSWSEQEAADRAISKRDFGSALRHLDRAMAALEAEGGEVVAIIRLQIRRADVLALMGRKDDSLQALSNAQGRLQRVHSPRLEVELLAMSAQVLERFGMLGRALQEMRALREAEARLANAENARLAGELEVRFDTKRKEVENQRLRAQQTESDVHRLALAVLLVLAVGMLWVLGLYLRKRTQAARIEVANQVSVAEAAAASDRAKTVFLSNMSHELRTPLNSILGYSRVLLRDSTLNERVRIGLATVQESGEHLLALINDILDLAQVESGKLRLLSDDVFLNRFLRVVADIIRVKADEKGVAFELNIGSRLPAAIRVDEKRLRQVLLNLLSNAVRFTDKGSVRLKIGARAQDGGRSLLRFEVEDSGIGIAQEHRGRIFQPFEQVSDLKRRSGGSGLGLAISRQLVNLMGGRLECSSQLGTGSRFWFEIDVPVLLGDVRSADERTLISGYEGRRRRVLVVDDVAGNRAPLVDLLTALGFDAVEAENGPTAMTLIQALRPDLVLMDIHMPGLSGLDVMRHFRQLSGFALLPMVAMSASTDDAAHAEYIEAGATAFLPKPIDHARLLDVMRQALHLEWMSEPGVPERRV